MNKRERFIETYNYLKYKGLIRTQKDVADKMKSSTSNVSSALAGVESVLTDKFLKRFCHAYPFINEDWLLNGNGQMLTITVEQTNVNGDNIHGQTVSVKKSETERLLDLLRQNQESLLTSQQQVSKLIDTIQQLTKK